eukprot:COSAG02_NODE_4734_length_5038_cov_120.236485_5_plen_80_part_00
MEAEESMLQELTELPGLEMEVRGTPLYAACQARHCLCRALLRVFLSLSLSVCVCVCVCILSCLYCCLRLGEGGRLRRLR